MNTAAQAQTLNTIPATPKKTKRRVGNQRAVGKKQDIHKTITDSIVEAIEKGLVGGFEMPWNRVGLGLPSNAKSGNNYNGINVLSLWVEASEKGFSSSTWATYKQWEDLGCQVKKGESGSCVVFYKQYEKEDAKTGESESRFALRFSKVFNANQVEGFDGDLAEEKENLVFDIKRVDDFVLNTGAEVHIVGDVACYIPSRDLIKMPEKVLFKGTKNQSPTEAFYHVLTHELTHWTKPKNRTDRKPFSENGKEAYAFEELVAELGSAFLCAELNIAPETREDHTCYIASWLDSLKNDPKFIFKAAAQASAAVEFLKSKQPK